MSSEEDKLPLELHKLEISSSIPQIKFDVGEISMALKKSEENSESLQNAKSRVMERLPRRSKSNLDECKKLLPKVKKQSFKSTAGITKKSLLREPVLRCLHDSICSKSSGCQSSQNSSSEEDNSQDIYKFRDFKGRFPSIKINCPLSKSSTTLQSEATSLVNDNVDSTNLTINESSEASSTMCSQEANDNNDTNGDGDVTVDELAGYFETMVHIPKKMSSMAESMYM